MPYSVISGFMSGIASILVILQIPPLVGEQVPKGGVIGTIISNIPTLITNINAPDLVLGGLTITILFLTPSKLKYFFPPHLIALIIGTLVCITVLQYADIARIPEIPAEWPKLQLPYFTPGQITCY